ncbi:response regulator transcription factor [Amycolatopsis sp. cmx-11-12]|uniref:helix-turn-helix transcriptional regulator n=1 Tax=Amycolatopsis sp. cmx-11-12 TaxID=2785795 RepID=UPI0039171719
MVSYLESYVDMKIVGGRRRDEADVVVAAFDRLSDNAIVTLRQSAAELGKPIVLMVNQIQESELAVAAECRVVAVLPRTAATGEQLPDSVRSAAAGRANPPLGSLGPLIERPAATNLSAREIDVLRLMADGLDTNQIAAELSYSERTVKNIIYAMTGRLRLRNRAHAVAYAVRTGAI